MALNFLRRTIKMENLSQYRRIFCRNSSIYTPDYLELYEPKYPLYPPLNVQIRGYDYPVLESYQKFVTKIAQNMEFTIVNNYAFPPSEFKITKFRPSSNTVDAEYLLYEYERDTQITDVPAVMLPVFIRVLEAALPEGVKLDIDEVGDRDAKRYIPDKLLLDLKDELQEVGADRKKKKKDKDKPGYKELLAAAENVTKLPPK